MIIAIVGITGFQGYWLKNNYDREKQTLELKTRAAFRQTILSLQASKLNLDKFRIHIDSVHVTEGTVITKKKQPLKVRRVTRPGESQVTLLNILQEKMRDSMRLAMPGKKTLIFNISNDSLRKVFIDSIRKNRGGVIITHSMDSSIPPPAIIREMRVDKAIEENRIGNLSLPHM